MNLRGQVAWEVFSVEKGGGSKEGGGSEEGAGSDREGRELWVVREGCWALVAVCGWWW